MESLKCLITQELFEDPVICDDGHTYERKAITDWLTENRTSPITRRPMDINSLRPNYIVKQMIEEFKTTPQSMHTSYQFELDVDIRKKRQRPLFQAFGKSIYEVEWVHRNGSPIVLLKIDGAKANREAAFYVQLSCHPHIVRTFGLVRSTPGSVMLLQEYAPHGDLSELLRENGFKPTEKVLCIIFQQICDAMVCLADNGIIHGDLACRNVLVFQEDPIVPKKNLVKLTDFGLTRASSLYSIVDSPAHSTMTIIPTRYAAPEIILGDNKFNYCEKSDVYSMGVLMWEACSYGELPYSSLDKDYDVRRRKLNDERLPRPPLCTDELWIIINECWHQDPEDRPNFQTLKQFLLNLVSEDESKMKAGLETNTNVYMSSVNAQTTSSSKSNTSSAVVLLSTGPFQVHDNDESGSTYACDCGQEYMNEESLKRHQQTNCVNRSVQCSFCQTSFSSSTALGDHLRLCGNKTDECPSCHQFIRRSYFAYHYENNCAPVERVETPPGRPTSRSGQHVPPNYNKPVARENVPFDDDENYLGQNSSMYPSRANGRIQSPKSSLSNSPVIIECEFCHHGCKQSDYKIHRDNCLKNPANINHRQPLRIPLKPNHHQGASNGAVHLPCEFCNQPVDLRNWANHTQNCRERENQRVVNLARSISQEPITEPLPCEYCQQLYSPKQLGSHEANCPKNPNNRESAARFAHPRSAQRFVLPVEQRKNESHPKPSNNRPNNNPRDVHYHSIDVDQTHAANSPLGNNKSSDRKSTNQYAVRRTASDDLLLHSDDSPRSAHIYDNELAHDDLSQPYRQDGISERARAASNSSRNIQYNQDPRGAVNVNRSPYHNDPKYQQKLHQRDGSYEIINNQPGRPSLKKRKKESWIKVFFAGRTNGYVSD